MAFTASAMWARSCRIDIISPRWYFITGHCPVTSEWLLAHPRPRRTFRVPVLASASAAPGSPVTYRPGMPSAPPARVTDMIEFSTAAGASPPPPWALASKPTASTAQSTSLTPSTSAIWSSRVASWLMSTVSQPKERACPRRSALRSPTMTTAAPSSCAEYAAASPTGPAPAT